MGRSEAVPSSWVVDEMLIALPNLRRVPQLLCRSGWRFNCGECGADADHFGGVCAHHHERRCRATLMYVLAMHMCGAVAAANEHSIRFGECVL